MASRPNCRSFMHRLLRICLSVSIHFLVLSRVIAQTDSVIVTGRIRNLSARLYRESPTVLVSRNNILQASRELVRPAPLNLDGTFRVALPLIYPQEEMYFNYGRISTAFLAAPGSLEIELDADSLFTTAVPFKFSGVNAQVNQQYARYKAFEAAYPNKPDAAKLSRESQGLSLNGTFDLFSGTYNGLLQAFSGREKLFPLLSQWIRSANRYNAASFVYEKATVEGDQINKELNDSLRLANDRLLTAARASAMNRFANYAIQQSSTPEINQRNNSLSIKTLSSLLIRYGRNLSEAERTRLQGYMDNNQAKASDIRFFSDLVRRSNDTIQRLVAFETLLQRSRAKFDDATTNYLAAYQLANALPSLTLDFARLLYDYARPQVKDSYLAQSLDELYQLETKDSIRIQAAVQTLNKAGRNASVLEISPGVFVTRDALAEGRALFDRIINANRGKVIYVLMTSPDSEGERQAALDAQRLRNTFGSRNFALVYLPNIANDAQRWAEFCVKNRLEGDHLITTLAQLGGIVDYLRPNGEISATIINRVGKIAKRNAPLPDALEEIKKVVDKNL
ncbi:hypothetical protein ACFSUS_18200 [Spirosoma soli]|uniref:Uncharacterized protein n=1 Tax=Spirosoma soli TaxID=1770529 RepID=A0ABW5M6F7_9BACT